MKPILGGLIVAAALAAAYGFGHETGKISSQEKEWADSSKAALAARKPYRAYQAAVADQVQLAQAGAERDLAATDRAIAVQDSLEREIEALRGDTAGMTTLEQEVVYWKGLYEKRTRQQMATAAALASRTRERNQAQIQVGVLTAGLGAAESRVAKLEGLLERGIELQDCRILGLIDCPSRTASFFGGAGLATVIALTS